MSVIIGISRKPDDKWWVNNVTFRELTEEIISRHPDDQEIADQLDLAWAFSFLGLDYIYDENPNLALRIRDSLKDVSDDIVSGEFSLKPIPDVIVDVGRRKNFFSQFSELLKRFHPDKQV